MSLTLELKEYLYEKGAALVGIGDMDGVENCKWTTGVSVAVPLPKHVIMDLKKAPTKEYREYYHTLNNKLNEIVTAGEAFLKERGYVSWSQNNMDRQ